MVDDNEDAANTLAMILKLEGHEVDTAYSGAQALERIEEFEPEIVLLDIGLPGLDGLQVAERIRAQSEASAPCAWWRLPATARKPIALARARRDSPAHLVKPVDFADLKRAIADLGAAPLS